VSGYRVFDEETAPYFVTCSIVAWAHVFTSRPYFDIVIDALDYCRRQKGLRLYAYVLMTNHLHLIARTDEPLRLPQVMRDLKRHTSRRIHEELSRNRSMALLSLFENSSLRRDGNTEGKVWQDGYHPIALVDRDRYLQRLSYLEENPVRKGYVDQPEFWRYSSARNRLLHDHSVLEIDELEWE
jgi:putative transposase